MESFIVRIYRRSHTQPGEVAGLIETVGREEKRAFQSFDGLVNTLRKAIFLAENTVLTKAEGNICDIHTISNKKQTG